MERGGESINVPQGCLIVNADDWGRDRNTTQHILDCIDRQAVSSVSAMIFMEDSERAAAMARERGIDAGLHLNLTAPFSAHQTPAPLMEHQQRLSRYLRSHRFARVVVNPWLATSFAYVVAAQLDEYSRLYGEPPARIDGHHHMHLCANVLFQKLLPSGTVVRRNFTFEGGEKGFYNRGYRRVVDRMLARRHHLSDCFFNLAPLQPAERLLRVFSLARHSTVEVETHPVKQDEYRFLTQGEMFRLAGDMSIAPRFTLRQAVVSQT